MISTLKKNETKGSILFLTLLELSVIDRSKPPSSSHTHTHTHTHTMKTSKMKPTHKPSISLHTVFSYFICLYACNGSRPFLLPFCTICVVVSFLYCQIKLYLYSVLRSNPYICLTLASILNIFNVP